MTAIIIVENNRFFHDSQTMLRHCVTAGCVNVSKKGIASANLQKRKLCEGCGLMLLSDNKVAGMDHPWILRCAPAFQRQLFYNRRDSFS